MGYSQDQPAIPPLSTNPVPIPLSPNPRDSPLQSPHRLSPPHDGPSSLPTPSFVNGTERPLPTRASTLGTAHELDHIKSQSDTSLPKHSLSEDLNHSSSTFVSPSPAFRSSSRPSTPGSSSHDRNQASSEHSGKSARQLSGASGSSQPTSNLADNRPAPSFSSSSATLVS